MVPTLSCQHRAQTQGKIERWHQTLKNRVLLENNYLPGAFDHPLMMAAMSPHGT